MLFFPVSSPSRGGNNARVRLTPALAHFKRHNDGILMLDERVEPVRFVLDPSTGAPIMPVQPDLAEADVLTLHVPDDSPLSLQILGTPRPLDPDADARCDRFLIYLGQPRGRNLRSWIMLAIEGVRFEGEIIEAGEVMQPNPFIAAEPAACRRANAHQDKLREACRRAGADVPAPLLVGIDPLGADIRATFGIVRIEWPSGPVADVDEGLRRLLEG